MTNNDSDRIRQSQDHRFSDHYYYSKGDLIAEQYTVISALGKGASGEVYKVKNSIGELEAIKVSHYHYFKADKSKSDFLKELSINRNLRHENLIPIFNVGSNPDKEQMFFTMKLMDGGDLGEWITKRKKSNTKIDLCEIANISMQIIQALAYIHDKNLIHQDVKPKNILIDEKGLVALGDFGLAFNYLSESLSLEISRTIRAGGTGYFLSPEQQKAIFDREKISLTPASDVFAFGLTLYNLITGELIAAKPDSMGLHISDNTLAKMLNSFLDRCWEKSPGDRFKDGSVLQKEFRTIYDYIKKNIPETNFTKSLDNDSAYDEPKPLSAHSSSEFELDNSFENHSPSNEATAQEEANPERHLLVLPGKEPYKKLLLGILVIILTTSIYLKFSTWQKKIHKPSPDVEHELDTNPQTIIEDSNFYEFLVKNFDTSNDGTLSQDEIDNITHIEFLQDKEPLKIETINGIHNLTNLKTLTIHNSKIKSLPRLPTLLEKLDASCNLISEMHSLPPSLDSLVINYNYLVEIKKLPDNLQRFSCNNNQVFKIQELPPTLGIVGCSNNQLVELPLLPPDLKTLECQHNKLKLLPELPESLNWLNCNFNKLESLPKLPPNLTNLYCSYNDIVALPKLPNPMLEVSASHNRLEKLPLVPGHMTKILCSYNDIQKMPNLPNQLLVLNLRRNKINDSAMAALDNVDIRENKLQIDLRYNYLTEGICFAITELNNKNIFIKIKRQRESKILNCN